MATLDALPGVSAGDVKPLGDQTAIVTTPKGKSDAQVLQELRGSPSVEFAERDYIRQVSAYAVPPNDPGYTSTTAFSWGGPFIPSAKSWWLRDTNANTGVGIASLWSSLEAPTFPARAAGSAIKVAVIDTGFYMTHPDAGTNIVAGKDEFATYSSATGITTKDNDVTPVDPAAPLNDITTASHGTCVAGQISAGTNNGVGVTSMSYDSTVMVYKVQGVWTDGDAAAGYPAGSAVIFDSAIIDAINDATAAGVKVINMSLGGPTYSQAIQDAIDNAWAQGVLVVAATGNSGTLDGVQYPGANAHVVGVGSYTVTGTVTPTSKAVSSFTDYGVGRDAATAGANNGRLDILAPGQGIWGLVQPGYDADGTGTVYEPGYYWWQGTSMASPAFAGMAAMVWRFAPALTADQVANVFLSTATDAGSPALGYGYVNPVAAYAKLKTDYPYLLAPASLTMPSSTTSTSVPVSWDAVAGTSVSYDVADNGVFVKNVAGLSTTLTLGLGSHFVTVTPRSDYNWWNAATNRGGTVVVTSSPLPPGTLSGTVRSGGVALPGATRSAAGTSSVTTAADGTYTVAGITPGAYDAAYSKSGYATQTVSVTIDSGATLSRDIALSVLPGTLSGTVRTGGVALPGATVSVAGTSAVTTAADGTYTVAGITPGTYDAAYSKSGYATLTRSVTIAADGTTVGNADLVLVVAPSALSIPAVSPTRPRHGRSVRFTGWLTPGTGASAGTVRLSFYRRETKTVRKKVRGRWRRVRVRYWHLRATKPMNAGSDGRLTLIYKLRYPGKWKMIARYSGAAGFAPSTSGARYFSVK